MQDLIDQIVAKTGITATQARDAVGMAGDWIKDKLPADLRDTVGGYIDGAGGLAGDAVEKSKDVAGSAADATKGAAGSAWDKAKDTVQDLMPGSSD